jgi:anti-sigma B factor antagonist
VSGAVLRIAVAEDGRVILAGRFDAAQADTAGAVLDRLSASCPIDLQELEYISSLGLGMLLKTHKRLIASGGSGLTLLNPNEHIRTIFRYSGFHRIFRIEPESG